MDRKTRIAALVIFGLLVYLLRDPVSDLTGHYEMDQSWTSTTGTSEPGPDGHDHVEVDVDRRGNSLLLEFEVSRDAPYQRILAACVDVRQEGNLLHFDFEDNWGNSGRGRFFQRGDTHVLDLECLGGEFQSHVGMLYSEWAVVKKSDRAVPGRAGRSPETTSARR